MTRPEKSDNMTEENTIIVDGEKLSFADECVRHEGDLSRGERRMRDLKRTIPQTIYKKRTSPKTIQIQASKTTRSKAEWLHISISEEDGEGRGTYDVGRRAMKRERLHKLKPKLKARYEKSLIVSAPPKCKFNARGVFKPASKNAVPRRKNLTL